MQLPIELQSAEETNASVAPYYPHMEGTADHTGEGRLVPPLWIGAQGESTLRLTARHADVWNISGGDPAFVKEVVGKFEDAGGTVGRNPAEVRKSLQFGWEREDPGDLIELSCRYYELGGTRQVVYLGGGHPAAM